MMKETETQFQARVIQAARLYGWLVHHCRPVQIGPGRWATPIQGDAGFPDLCLARGGVVLLVELKADGKYLAPAQKLWRDAAGDRWRLWRPRDWDEVVAELS